MPSTAHTSSVATHMPSTALTKRPSSSVLMPPPTPPPKRIKRPTKVLDEDAYADALSHIIARDFFPGLVEAESQQEYLNALDSHDARWIASAGRKLAEVMTPGPDGRRARGRRGTSVAPAPASASAPAPTPRGLGGETPRGWAAGSHTPASVASAASAATAWTAKAAAVDTGMMSLGAFQSRYTSEDNESFYRLLDRQNSKKSQRYAWLWASNKIPAGRQLAHRERERRLLAARSAEEAENDDGGGGGKSRSLQAADSRPAMPDTWTSRPDNTLMFAPPSIEDAAQTVQQRAEADSRAAPKRVVYDNTRMPSSHPTAPPPPSPSLSAVRAAIAGRPRLSASEAGPSSTPRINGYSFVDSDEPDGPAPATSPLFPLPAADAGPNPFTIRDKSSREALHHRMVDRVARSKRPDKRLAALRTPAPRFASSPRPGRTAGALTPAARGLLTRAVAAGGRTPAGGAASIWEGAGTPRTTRTRAGPGAGAKAPGATAEATDG